MTTPAPSPQHRVERAAPTRPSWVNILHEHRAASLERSNYQLTPVGMEMTTPQELPPARRRWLIFWAVLRGLVVATVLVVLYYVLPFDRPLDAGTAARLLLGLLVFAGVAVWRIRTIVGSRYPAIRASRHWDGSSRSMWCYSPRRTT